MKDGTDTRKAEWDDAVAVLRDVGLEGWAASSAHIAGAALVIARVRELLRDAHPVR